MSGLLPYPSLTRVYRLEATVGEPLDLGDMAQGRGRIVPLTGGTFTGPDLTVKLLPGSSADWQIVLPDGTALGDIRYTLRTDDGILLYVRSRGVRHGSANVLAGPARGAAGRQPGSARQRGALTDHGNSAAAPQVHVRHAWQQGGDPPIGSNGAVHGMPAGAAAGRHAHCNLWSARAHSRHTYATVLPATIEGIRARFGNPTQITLLRMPASAGSPHEKTVHNGGSRAPCGPSP